MRIPPSPRILKMLGEIQFDEWQCVAELIDNSFDDFTEIVRSGQPWAGGMKVSVALPSAGGRVSDSTVVIRDTGQGMSLARLERAVRAGWSSNDRFDKLGLFGMGFNVATARLGRKTRVLTTRVGDPEWIGVEIDLDKIGEDFEALDLVEPKADPNEHGTRIEISKLNPVRAEWLRKNQANLRTTLGKLYSWILEHRGYELWVQGTRVLPRRHCRWGDDRFVLYGNGSSQERVPAFIPIDQTFDPGEVCLDCGNWQAPNKGICDQCGSGQLSLRQRRIHGWLGVQRHLDKREFGIDFLRNGRKILQWDKRLFDWQNPNDPLGVIDVEYPIELVHQGGRLVGEIHLDHVPVTYQKDAFDYGDRSWKAAMDFLRGAGPLQPEKAKKAGYPENASPLGLLYKGYRRNAAGTRCLIPGDGTGPIHEQTRLWAQKFHNGVEEYQNDERWWEAVANHDERVKEAKLGKTRAVSPERPDEAAVIEALGDLTSAAPPVGDAPAVTPSSTPASSPKSPAETARERLDRYQAQSTIIPELTRDFGLPRLGDLRVETRRVVGTTVTDDAGHDTPLLLVQGAGGTATAYVDASHDAFGRLGVDPAELLLTEIAMSLRVRANSDLPISHLITELRRVCMPDTALDVDTLTGQAREVLNEIRWMMVKQVDSDPARAFQYLTAEEVTATENEMIANGILTAGHLGANAEFLLYAPPLYLVRLFESWPEAFLDGTVFVGPYEAVSSQSSRALSVARVAGYLNDIATLLSFRSNPGSTRLQRTRLSLRLLLDETASGE
ncbi:conserved hypothetical protein [Catenulispora acidiphila DSM 44928]|uniref:Uncharacterized protein n=1 Tax=Catenulispora acidiphila (strain DSM 44928 / JCM 14897 / NBRC 102108 / NRRL B-24433 / ID139908) TaxID=479433 RepID=C7Q8S1_CATAD|nr:ATP-binding protein [Catenulispora acidiphila]ACU70336.1 conserved hypothetical protein [Catenulispora acidiphila DSM 44928]